MKNKTYTLNTLLAVAFGASLLVCMLVKTFAPRMILPAADIPNLTALSLAVLLLDHYLAPGAKRCYICIPVFSAVTFGLLSFAASFAGAGEALKLAVLGGLVFTAVTWLFSSMTDRISTGPMARLAPFMSALGLYLASQCFMGMAL